MSLRCKLIDCGIDVILDYIYCEYILIYHTITWIIIIYEVHVDNLHSATQLKLYYAVDIIYGYNIIF